MESPWEQQLGLALELGLELLKDLNLGFSKEKSCGELGMDPATVSHLETNCEEP